MFKKNSRGFTLIELMIVVAIIGILAAIAIPKFADLLTKAKEGVCRGNVQSFRSTINIYYSDNEGVFPVGDGAAVEALLVPTYIKEIPEAKTPPHHPDNATITAGSAVAPSDYFFGDTGGWGYTNDSSQAGWGTVVVDCTHQDSTGTVWHTR